MHGGETYATFFLSSDESLFYLSGYVNYHDNGFYLLNP
jgi:hypothetical protein